MVGGFLWCTGNMMCGPTIQLIGMSLGLLLWGGANMVVGWATGTFGLFGLNKNPVTTPAMNYVGVILVLAGLLIFLQIKSSSAADAKQSNGKGFEPLIHDDELGVNTKSDVIEEEAPFGASLSPNTRRILGICMALLAGVLFGCSFDPAQYVIDHDYDGSDDSLNYVFPHYCGILLTSWAYTILYTMYLNFQGKDLFVNTKCLVPATISGVLWGIAEIAWFVANGRLGFSVSFPIITSGPGLVGALWGVLVFKEITGAVNLRYLGFAFATTIVGIILIAVAHN